MLHRVFRVYRNKRIFLKLYQLLLNENNLINKLSCLYVVVYACIFYQAYKLLFSSHIRSPICPINTHLSDKTNKYSGTSGGATYVTVDSIGYDSANNKLGLKVDGADAVIPFSGGVDTWEKIIISTGSTSATGAYLNCNCQVKTGDFYPVNKIETVAGGISLNQNLYGLLNFTYAGSPSFSYIIKALTTVKYNNQIYTAGQTITSWYYATVKNNETFEAVY